MRVPTKQEEGVSGLLKMEAAELAKGL